MLRIAIIGCGKIADDHVQAIQRISDCEIVAVCDREPLMAKQLGERFGVPECFTDLKEMLRVTKPDVVHITTPPQSHYSIGKQCLEAGSHVYLEKPFTITADSAESLIQLSEKLRRKVTVGHNGQFTLEMMEMRRLVNRGFLGGEPVHLESYFYYDLGDGSSTTSLLSNPEHWVHQLPGRLLHNVISHGIAKIAEFLDDEIVETIAIANKSPRIQAVTGAEMLDELRVLIRDKRETTALFSFSTQIKGLNQLRLYGSTGSISVDHFAGSVVRSTESIV